MDEKCEFQWNQENPLRKYSEFLIEKRGDGKIYFTKLGLFCVTIFTLSCFDYFFRSLLHGNK